MENKKIERHPFTPFLPGGCKVVMCGTFPPKPEKWAMDFFYPNFYNDMWRIFGFIFYNDKEKFFNKGNKTVDKAGIQQMLKQYGIGIGETVREAVRTKDNASDKFLEIVTPVDLPDLLKKAPECVALITTGEKAASIIASLTDTAVPVMGESVICEVKMPDGEKRLIKHYRLPSTSRAYPMKFEEKASYYKKALKEIGVL